MSSIRQPTAEENLRAAGVSLGQSYRNECDLCPEPMRGCLITVREVYEGLGCTVAYDYVQTDGRGGSGMLAPAHARQVLARLD